MKGFRAEPGERSACVMSIDTGALARQIAAAADMGPDLAGRVVDDERRARDLRAEAGDTLAHERFQSRLEAGVDGETMHIPLGLLRHRGVRCMRGEHREGPALGRHRLGLRDLSLGSGERAALARRDRGPGRAPCAPRPGSGPGGAAPAIAAEPRAARPRLRTDASAPGRNTTAPRRASPRDCRRRARASGKDRGSRAC